MRPGACSRVRLPVLFVLWWNPTACHAGFCLAVALRTWHSLCAEPNVLRGDQVPALKWIAADEEGLVKFLVGEKSFNEDRVRKAVQRINAAKSKSTQGQRHTTSSCHRLHLHHMESLDISSEMCTVDCRAIGKLFWCGDHQEIRHGEEKRA